MTQTETERERAAAVDDGCDDAVTQLCDDIMTSQMS